MKVSIVTPVYNSENQIEKCIQSILKQTHKNLELILIDDGSTDSSGTICDRYAKQDSRIKVIHQDNKGVSTARNVGINNSTGDYLVFIDSDDYVESDYLELMLKTLKTNSLVVECSLENKEEILLNKSQALSMVFNDKMVKGYPWGKLYDMRIIKSNTIRFNEDISICEDMLFNINYIIKSGAPICLVNSNRYKYLDNDTSTLNRRFIGKNYNEKWLTEIDAYLIAEKLLIDFPDALKVCQLRKTKAAVTTLRTMTANNVSDSSKYFQLRRILKDGFWGYLLYYKGELSSKISLVLGLISPRMELKSYWLLKRIRNLKG